MASSGADQPKAAFDQLRKRLDDFYSCLYCCLHHIHVKEAFLEMCNVLNKELQALIEFLRLLEDAFQEELPLESEEPKGVNWGEELERLIGFRNMILRHKLTLHSDSYVTNLMKSFEKAAACMRRIDAELLPEDDYEIYVSYSMREMNNYKLNRWSKEFRKLRNDIAEATLNRRNEHIENRLNQAIEELHSVGTFFFSKDSSIIYHEGLGRHLWQIRHTDKPKSSIDDILGLIMTVEYLCSRIDRKFVFIDRENSPEEETEETRLKRNLEETLQSQLPKVLFRLKRCSNFLHKDFSEEFIDEMLRNLIASEHSAKVCEKMCKRKINKFTLQIAGLLKEIDVFVGCSSKDLAKAIDFKQPTVESCVDYIRKKIDDELEIQEWITNYTVQYRNSHNGS